MTAGVVGFWQIGGAGSMVDDERRRLVARAFAPEATRADLEALAAFERRPRPTTSAPPAPSRRWRRSRATLIGGAALVALLAGIGGWAVGHGAAETSAPPARTTASSALREVETTLPKFVAPEEFTLPQIASDLPRVPIPSTLERASFRQVSFGDVSPPLGSRLYVTKDTTGYDCLVAVHDGSLDSTCVSGQYFPASGLTLTFARGTSSCTVTWLPDGSMSLAFT
jgi:hypothetical protein